MCFITVDDINQRLNKYPLVKIRHEIARLELPPAIDPEIDDTWPCISAVLKDGTRQMLWTVFGQGRVYNIVLQVLEDFNRSLHERETNNAEGSTWQEAGAIA